MKKLTTKQIIGIMLMFLGVCAFVSFIWWGTTNYHVEFAIGIILVSLVCLIGGMLTYNSDY